MQDKKTVSGVDTVPPVPPFRPLPLLGNPHVQTVLANLLPGQKLRYASQCYSLVMPDGDCLVGHDSLPPRWRPGQGVVLFVHGLGGSHRSKYMIRLANALLDRGLRVVRLDLRGAGAGAGLARTLYNGGCSADVRAAVAAVHSWTPASRIDLVGMSLGGNIILKLAGEAAAAPVPGLGRVAAVSPPIDLEACAVLLAAPSNRSYEKFYVRSLIRQVRRHQHFFPDLPVVRFGRATTLRLFDDRYTAPRGGFGDAVDYYRRSSAFPLLERIQARTFILSARDDPFIAVEPFERLRLPDGMEVHLVPRGGHLEFLGWDGAGGLRWGEQRVVDWLTRR